MQNRTRKEIQNFPLPVPDLCRQPTAAHETRIAQRREFYNDSVLLFNTNISTIPGVFIADQLKFQPREYFRIDEDVETPVKVAVNNM